MPGEGATHDNIYIVFYNIYIALYTIFFRIPSIENTIVETGSLYVTLK